MIGQRYRRFISSVAIFAVLLMAFAPTLTHALMAKSAAPWQELCTAQGLKLADATLADNQSPPQPDQHHHIDECPFCGTHVHNTAIVEDTTLVVAFSDQLALVDWFYQSPAVADHHQLSHPAQGPPVV